VIPQRLSSPWAITEEGMQLVLAVATRGELFEDVKRRALEARGGEPLANAHSTTTRKGVAVIPIAGPLMRHANMLTEISGATSYGAVRKDLQLAMDDPKVRSILLRIDSPGGEVTGVSEMAQAIHEADKTKPIKAYVEGSANSAAYWLASATREIVAAPTASLGSIGVLMAVLDGKAEDGRITFVSSQSPNKRPDLQSDEGRAQYQRLADDTADVFISDVARFRGVSREVVLDRYGAGGTMIGARAIAAGLADRIGSFESVLAELATREEGRARMNHATMMGLSEDVSAEQVGERIRALVETEVRLLAATGAPNVDEAIGRVRAGAEAIGELSTLRAEKAAAEEARLQIAFRAALEGAVAGARMSLADVVSVAQLVLDDEEAEKAQLAVNQLDTRTGPAVVAAVSSVKVSARAMRRLEGYLAGKGAAAPKPHGEKKPVEGGTGPDAQMRAINEYKTQHPNSSTADAYVALAVQRPELFRDLSNEEA
jgi:ClpP class serine protease